MICTKTILARASSLRASKKRDSEQLRARDQKRKKERVCERWPWGTATVPGGTHIQIMVMTDRFPLARHSPSFLSRFFSFCLPPLRSHRRRTLVASTRPLLPLCIRAQLAPSFSYIYGLTFDILIQYVTRYTDAVRFYGGMPRYYRSIGCASVSETTSILGYFNFASKSSILESNREYQKLNKKYLV